jgi:hypothetical protein
LKFNLVLLKAFACVDREVELAYQLGRLIRDTSNPPVQNNSVDPSEVRDAVTTQLSRRRIAQLRGWLTMLNEYLPGDSGTIVGGSLGKWSEFSTIVLCDHQKGKLKKGLTKEAEAVNFIRPLLDQGDIWLNLLTGETNTNELLTPESYVAAGEAALSRTTRIIGRIVLHYWFAEIVLAMAAASIIVLSARYLGGPTKVWTQIVTIASALGVTAKGIGSSLLKLANNAEEPIFQREEVDAITSTITSLPVVSLTHSGVRALRHQGVQKSRSLGRA